MKLGRKVALFGVTLYLLWPVVVPAVDGPLVISEFRLRGASGVHDEFVEIYNASSFPHTVAAVSGTGYGLASSNGVVRFTIPNGTIIPARGHFLGVNGLGYSISSYPAGHGSIATGDVSYATDIPDNAGIALFNNNTGGASFTLANRFDAVGSTSEANTLYKEGAGYAALALFNVDHSLYRSLCPVAGSCSGQPTDTGNNATDFLFVDTNGTNLGFGQRLGAPGPENLSSPIRLVPGTAALAVSLVDPGVDQFAPPNYVRDNTSSPADNSTFGTMAIRRKVTNNSAVPLTRLRFRVVDINTFPSPNGTADLRTRTSSGATIGLSTGGRVTIAGTSFETPPSQPNGGAFNATLSAGSITLGTPLAAGASVDLEFLLGIQQAGTFRFAIVLESLPAVSSNVVTISGNTDAVTATTSQFLISEFRLRGPNGANDEFVEVYNNSDANLWVYAYDGSAGYALVSSDGVVRFTIPNGTFISPRGHYLGTFTAGGGGYSLSAYPAGVGTATGDVTYASGIGDNVGIALFRTANVNNRTLINRLDAVGPASEVNTLYKEGTGYGALAPLNINFSFYRDVVTSGAGEGIPRDTNNNATDFLFVDTNGTSAGGGQRLGAPGPENGIGPTPGGGGSVTHAALDPAQNDAVFPNVLESTVSDPANNSTFGTISVRRTFTNATGEHVTSLRFRVVDLSTFPSPAGTADLRPRTSNAASVTRTDSSVVTVQGTTLEQPPSQPNGGGFNSTLSVTTVTAGTPLFNGESISVQFLLGVQQVGCYRFAVMAESYPSGAGKDVFVVTNTLSSGITPTATATAPTSVSLTWAASSCAQYEIFRSETGLNYVGIGVTAFGQPSFTDASAAANTAYLYRIRAVSNGVVSPLSTPDLATTVSFTDPTLTAGSTPVKAAHITQLRTAINAVRTLAQLGAASFTNPTITPGVTAISPAHITEMRTALDQARAALGLPVTAYTDPVLTIGVTPVKALHVSDLRSRLQ